MAEQKFTDSVHEFIARNGRSLTPEKRETWARNQIALRRTGTLNYTEAMQAVSKGKSMTRPGWAILRAVLSFNEHVSDWEFDNVHGWPGGIGAPYSPTEEDRQETDWMEYQVPEDIFEDFGA